MSHTIRNRRLAGRSHADLAYRYSPPRYARVCSIEERADAPSDLMTGTIYAAVAPPGLGP